MGISRRTVVSIPCGPSALAVKEAAWGLARYAAISQVCFHFQRYILASYTCCSLELGMEVLLAPVGGWWGGAWGQQSHGKYKGKIHWAVVSR